MSKSMRLTGAVSILCVSFQVHAAPIGGVVQTKSGKVSGAAVQESGDTVHIYKGIPYAAPPVGE